MKGNYFWYFFWDSVKPIVFVGVLLAFAINNTNAQNIDYGVLKGNVVASSGEGLPHASIFNSGGGTTSKAVGRRRIGITDVGADYKLKLEVGKSYSLTFKYIGYKPFSIDVILTAGEVRILNVTLTEAVTNITEVDIAKKKDTEREKVSTISLDAKNAKVLPSPFGDFNKLLATLPGVVSNNELSSQYAVRGGNYDENLVYVNDIEIYKPQLVKAGQQEGLSFVNPDLVKAVEFSSGGWQPRFGDKLSSVLNVRYKEPKENKASVTAGILNQQAHFEGVTKNRRLSLLLGIRRKSSQYLFQQNALFKGLPVQGQYLPQFIDMQALIAYNFTTKEDSLKGKATTLSLLLSYANNKYYIKPLSQQTDFGTLTSKKRLTIAFEGDENLNYDTYQAGLKLSHTYNSKWQSDITLSGVSTSERERSNVLGFYRLCDVQTDNTKDNFNQCAFVSGAGANFKYGRNDLDATVLTLLNRNYFKPNAQNTFEFGSNISSEIIRDKIYEYTFTDSADYNNITSFLKTANDLNTVRLNAYAQHTYQPTERVTFTYGSRLGYGSLNKQVLVSPRMQVSVRPNWKKDVVLKAAIGVYQQPPFYREMRNYDGIVDKTVKAQTSYHFVAGLDYKFLMWNREFKFTTEAYYKKIDNVIPYDVDNVRIRYYGGNYAKAYATGVDFRVGGDFIQGAESWFSLGLLSTQENLTIDTIGYVRRPSDQRVTVGIFFQDHIPGNPSLRVYVNTVFGSGLPVGPPNNVNARGSLLMPTYRRVDLGFSKVIDYSGKTGYVAKYVKSIWLGIEVLNLLGAENTISYTWIKDFQNVQYGVPNTLSARFLNIRGIAYF